MSAPPRRDFVVRMPVRDEQGRVVGEVEAVRFRGLLHLAHEDQLSTVWTEVVELPNDGNGQRAVVRAMVETRKGSFSAIGDANPSNTNRRVVPHIIRLAETRAIARALRLAVNIGAVAVEELGDDFDPADHRQVDDQALPPPPAVDVTPARQRGRDHTPDRATPGDARLMSSEQRRYLFRLAFAAGETRQTALGRVLGVLGVDKIETATRVQAAKAIDALKAELADHEAERSTIQNGAAHG